MIATRNFGDILIGNEDHAIARAQAVANEAECPCGVWYLDGWHTVSEVAPELIEPDPEAAGWALIAVVDPHGYTEWN